MDQPQNPRNQRVTWGESLTEGPKILGHSVRNLFIRIYWLPRFVHPCCNANPGPLDELCGIFVVTGVTWKVISSLFDNCLFCLSIHFHFSYYPPLFLLFSAPVVLSLCLCVIHCWCRHTGRQSYMTLPSELYNSIVFVHRKLHCYFVWLGLFQVIGLPLTWKELSNIIINEIYLGSKPNELTG